MTDEFEDLVPFNDSVRIHYRVEGQGPPLVLYRGTTYTQMPNAEFVSLPGLTHGETFFRGDLVVPHVAKSLAQQRGA